MLLGALAGLAMLATGAMSLPVTITGFSDLKQLMKTRDAMMIIRAQQ